MAGRNGPIPEPVDKANFAGAGLGRITRYTSGIPSADLLGLYLMSDGVREGICHPPGQSNLLPESPAAGPGDSSDRHALKMAAIVAERVWPRVGLQCRQDDPLPEFFGRGLGQNAT